MVAIVYMAALLLTLPIASILLMGSLVPGLVLWVIILNAVMINNIADAFTADPPAPPTPTMPRARFDVVDAEYHILSRTYQIEAPASPPALRHRCRRNHPPTTRTPGGGDDGAA